MKNSKDNHNNDLLSCAVLCCFLLFSASATAAVDGNNETGDHDPDHYVKNTR